MINRAFLDANQRNYTARKVIYYISGIIEILFAFRIIFKLLGANPNSGFVSFIYTISRVFLAPFTAIFRSLVTQGIETASVLEPNTIIAMVVYGLIAWGIVNYIIIIKEHNENQI